MRKILFAVMAIAVGVLTTSCNKNGVILKTFLSVEGVTEHTIKVRCTYTPDEKDDAGYLVLRTTTNQIDDEIRKKLVEIYPMVEPCHESRLFQCDSLAADRMYCFWAVSYKKEKNGEVTIANIETMNQRTLACNDSRISYTQDGSEVTFAVQLGDEIFSTELGYLFDNIAFKYYVSVTLTPETALVNANEIGDNKYYKDGNMVCTVDIDMPGVQEYYAYKPVSGDDMYRKYKFEVSVAVKMGGPADVLGGLVHKSL